MKRFEGGGEGCAPRRKRLYVSKDTARGHHGASSRVSAAMSAVAASRAVFSTER